MRKKGTDGRWTVETPHKLFDYLREMYGIKSDSELARVLNSHSPLISRIRSGAVRITAKLVLEIHKQTKLPIEKIEEMAR